jgi:tetratricopeptide (TPR) repeat protein
MRLPFFTGRKAGSKRKSSKVGTQAKPIEAPTSVLTEAEASDQAEPASSARKSESAAAAVDLSDQARWVSAAETPKTEADAVAEGDVNDWLRRAGAAGKAGDPAEARKLLEAAVQRFPEAATVRHDLARLAEAGQDWPEAERWWREFAALSPTVWSAVIRIAHLLRLQGHLADAEVLVAEALERFPDQAPVLIDYARMAEMRRDWPEAGVRWTVLAARFPDLSEGLTGQARSLREQGQPDQARALLEGAMERFPAAIGPVDELARLAEAMRDWPAAERWWREVQVLGSHSWPGYVRLATALREQQRIAEAEEVLSGQFEHHAGEPVLFIEYARLAERSANWLEAARRWEDVTNRFPGRWDGYSGRARALRQQGDLEAAKDVLTDAAERFPTHSLLLHDLARLAEAQRDWSDAEQSWRRFLLRDPNPWWAYTGLATALREQQRIAEAEEVLSGQFERHAGEPVLFIEHAGLAERVADWPEAARRWGDVTTKFPDRWEGYGGRARALRQQGELEAAKDVLTVAAERLPTHSLLLHDLARLAEAQRDWPTAEQSWRRLLSLDPVPWWTYVGLATALREQRRITEAEEVLSGQFERLAAVPMIFIEHARLAERSADWPEALDRWADVMSRFPDRWEGYGGRAKALRQRQDLEAAENVLTEAVLRFPTHSHLLVDLARLAEAQRDWSAAEQSWRRLLSLGPGPWWAYTGLATALRQQQRIAEAEEVLSGQFERHAGEPVLFIDYAWLAERAANWPEAASRWEDVLTRFPNRRDDFGHHARALRERADMAAAQDH